MQSIDVAQPEEAILRLSFAVEHGQNNARLLRLLVVHDAVSGEMDDPITIERSGHRSGPTRIEIKRLQRGSVGNEPRDGIRLEPRCKQSRNREPTVSHEATAAKRAVRRALRTLGTPD